MTESIEAVGGADDNIALTDVMLAMDVVDTLRHQESLVERELNEEDRERELIERVKRSYASQGIEVSDATIAAGVRALKEQRFSYEPAAPGFKTRLLELWVGRRGVGRGMTAVLALAAIIGGAWYGFVELPAGKRIAENVAALNSQIGSANVDIRALDQRRVQLIGALDEQAKGGASADVGAGYDRQVDAAQEYLDSAARRLESASTLGQSSNYTPENYARLSAVAKRQLEQQRAQLQEAETSLNEADAIVGRLARLRGLPLELSLLRDEATELAIESIVDQRIEDLYRDGLAALRQGDARRAEAQTDELKGLIEDLSAEYTLTVVSRPDELSGAIREPPNNKSASNYYLIVEALDRNGEPVSVAIRSEEDGETRVLSRWGVRVDKALFDQVRQDKADDGIIQGRHFGRKLRGYLTPKYDKPTTGAAITSW